jgi:hypothetical protein
MHLLFLTHSLSTGCGFRKRLVRMDLGMDQVNAYMG